MVRLTGRIFLPVLALLGVDAAGAAVPSPPPSACMDTVCVSGMLDVPRAPSAAAEKVAVGGIKFHPGHYVSHGRVLRSTEWNEQKPKVLALIKLLEGEPVQGIRLHAQWGWLEGATPGDYAAGKARLKEILDYAQAAGKRVTIELSSSQFGGYPANPSEWDAFFPRYIIDDPKYGISTMKNGIVVRKWQTATMDRIIELWRAYGAEFNSHPALEMVGAGETSVAVPSGTDGYSVAALDAQFRRLNAAVVAAFPNTGVRLNSNYFGSDNQMRSLIDHAVASRMAIGGPDTSLFRIYQSNQIFRGYDRTGARKLFDDLSGTVPFVSEVQDPSLGGYQCSDLSVCTPAGLFGAARNGYTFKGESAHPVWPVYFMWGNQTYQGGNAQKLNAGQESILPYIRSINGYVTNGKSSSLVSPASVPCPAAYRNCDRS